MIKDVTAKSMLHYHKKTFSTNWDANIYRGCAHRCAYCFATYSHKYLEADFFGDIFVKTNAADVLEKEFAKKSWQHEAVCVAGVSDAYQPIESMRCIMPKVLKTFIAAKNPLAFSTKSVLPLRDLDLFAELAKVAEVSIAVSVSVVNEEYRKIIEPAAAPTQKRIEMLKEFKKIGVNTGILFMPIMPYFSDTNENLEEVFSLAKDAQVNFLSAWTLHLRGNTKKVFFDFLAHNYAEFLPQYKKLYYASEVNSAYKTAILQKITDLRKKYQLFNNYRFPKQKANPQLLLFD